MSTTTAASPKVAVTLLHLGVGVQEISVAEGATVADLLRGAGLDPSRQEIMIDGKPLADWVSLRPGAIISLLPRPAAKPHWSESVGSLAENPMFDEMMRDIEAAREAEKDRSCSC